MKVNDIIARIDNVDIDQFSDLQGYLSSKRPGDVVSVTVIRSGGKKQFKVRLANQFGKETIGELDFSKYLIGDLKKLSSKNATKFKINYGVEFIAVKNRTLINQGVSIGDIILKINDSKVYDTDDVENILRRNKGKRVFLHILNKEKVIESLALFVQN